MTVLLSLNSKKERPKQLNYRTMLKVIFYALFILPLMFQVIFGTKA